MPTRDKRSWPVHPARVAAIALIGASVAACSADVSRFSGGSVFTGSTDNQRTVLLQQPDFQQIQSQAPTSPVVSAGTLPPLSDGSQVEAPTAAPEARSNGSDTLIDTQATESIEQTETAASAPSATVSRDRSTEGEVPITASSTDTVPVATLTRDTGEPESSVEGTVATAVAAPQPVVRPGQVTSPAEQPRVNPEPAASVESTVSAEPVASVEPTVQFDSEGFRWPASGRMLSEFGDKLNGQRNDGINILVPAGTPIKAAGSGQVIYAGNEIRNFGNLVLVSHAGGYVTAYAHASELLVNRGDTVSRGQVIARAGASGSVDQPQLHFELRKGSTPVDPRPYLAGN